MQDLFINRLEKHHTDFSVGFFSPVFFLCCVTNVIYIYIFRSSLSDRDKSDLSWQKKQKRESNYFYNLILNVKEAPYS